MPTYIYEHTGEACELDHIFELVQSIKDTPLSICPNCQGPVRKRIPRVNINKPKGNSEWRDMGFSKLVKRDDGVYENVTRRGNEPRYMERGKPETMPDISKITSK